MGRQLRLSGEIDGRVARNASLDLAEHRHGRQIWPGVQ